MPNWFFFIIIIVIFITPAYGSGSLLNFPTEVHFLFHCLYGIAVLMSFLNFVLKFGVLLVNIQDNNLSTCTFSNPDARQCFIIAITFNKGNDY